MSKAGIPVVVSEDGKKHEPVRSGDVFDVSVVPVSLDKANALVKAEDGLLLAARDLVSAVEPNALVAAPDAKLRVEAGKLFAGKDADILKVSDNKISTGIGLVFEEDKSLLTLTGVDGAQVAQVKLPPQAGLPVQAEILYDFTPPPSDQDGVLAPLPEGDYMHLQFLLADGTRKDLYINVDGMAQTYDGGFGVKVTGSDISVDWDQLLAKDDSFLSLDDDDALQSTIGLEADFDDKILRLTGVGGAVISSIDMTALSGVPTAITLVSDATGDYLKFEYVGPDGEVMSQLVSLGSLPDDYRAGAGISIDDGSVSVVYDEDHGIGVTGDGKLTIMPSQIVSGADKILFAQDGLLQTATGLRIQGGMLQLLGRNNVVVAQADISGAVTAQVASMIDPNGPIYLTADNKLAINVGKLDFSVSSDAGNILSNGSDGRPFMPGDLGSL